MNTLSRQFCPDLRSARLPRLAAMAATFMLFVAASPVRAASFITEVKLIGGTENKTDTLKTEYRNAGWTVINSDLNAGAGGDFIYLLYKTADSDDGANHSFITDFYISDEGGVADDSHTSGGRTYHLVPYDGGDHFKEKKGDLNSNTGHDSANIHLYYTTDSFSDCRAVTGITFNATSSGAVVWNGNVNPADLNAGAGGDYIYMHLATAHQPQGSLDVCQGGSASITVSGWAFDPDAPAESLAVQVKVYKADGTTLYTEKTRPADRPRNDVNTTYGITGNHGFSIGIPIEDAGNYKVKVYAVDHDGSGNPQIGSTTSAVVTTGANRITIGKGNSTDPDFPFSTDREYSLTQQIYTAEEIGTAGTITSIAFRYDRAFSMSGVQVYLTHTDLSEFPSANQPEQITAADKVFEGTFSAQEAGWATIKLDTPFEYEGDRNLLVCCCDPTEGYSEGPECYCHDTGKSMNLYYISYTPELCLLFGKEPTKPDISNLAAFFGSKNTYRFRNDIRLGIIPNIFQKPQNLGVGNCSTEAATLTWDAPQAESPVTGYAYQYKKSSEGEWSPEAQTTATSASINGLLANTDYDFRVKALYDGGNSSYAVLHFTSTSAMPLPYACGFENGMDTCRMMVENGWKYTGIHAEAARTGEFGFEFSSYSFGEHDPQYLIFPRFAGTEALNVSFLHYADTQKIPTFQVGCSSTSSDPSAFTWDGEVAPAYHEWTKCERTFPEGTKYVAIRFDHVGNNTTYNLFLDDFIFEGYSPYAKPTNLVVSALTDQSATLAWTAADASATGCAFQYRKLTDSDWSAEATVNATSVTLDGLAANTEYEFRVKALYADDHASNYESTRFMTEGPTESLPHLQGFEDGMGGWRIVDGRSDTGISSSLEVARTGNCGFKFIQHSTPQYLMSPRLDSSSPLTVSFWYTCFAEDLGEGNYQLYTSDFQVGYSTTTKDPSAFTWGRMTRTIYRWQPYTVAFPADTRYVAIKWVDGYFLYIDDICITDDVSAHFSVNDAGTEYTIHTAAGWDVFCYCLDDNDAYDHFSGKTVKLDADIAVTRLAGDSTHEFRGTFDGLGHTLTVSYTNDDSNVRTAPFSYVDGATIRNLVTAGTIAGSAYRAAGIVGDTVGAKSLVSNCVSRVDIGGDRYTGGLSVGGNVEIVGCAYVGKIVATSMSGGFVGYSHGNLAIRDSLFAPQEGSSVSGGTFYYNGGGEITPVNSYYTQALGAAQGTAASVHTPANGDTPRGAGNVVAEYGTSGITAYEHALRRSGLFYMPWEYAPHSYAEWAAAYGLGAWNATDSLGVCNIFRYAFAVPTGPIADPPLLSLSLDASGNYVVRTPPLSLALSGFDLSIQVLDSLVDESSRTTYPLDPSGTTVIPPNDSPARFFRLRAKKHIDVIVEL